LTRKPRILRRVDTAAWTSVLATISSPKTPQFPCSTVCLDVVLFLSIGTPQISYAAKTTEENKIVCKGNVKPLPIVEIIFIFNSLPSGSVHTGLRSRSNQPNISAGRTSFNICVDIESDALSRSIVKY
jgi:hypothetical protein